MRGMNDRKRVRCPMCKQVFVNPAKLNRHKRTCSAKEEDE